MPTLRQLCARSRNFLLRLITKSHDFASAQRQMLSSGQLSDEERRILLAVSLKVHPVDDMYVPGRAVHYLSVGLSALRCAKASLSAAGYPAHPHSILDFPCGHGRVARFLRAAFPQAKMTGGDIDNSALRFCSEAFGLATFRSEANFGNMRLEERFDFVWCGSLATHLDEEATKGLLGFLYRHLAGKGLCVFTTHGRFSERLLRSGENTYGLPPKSRQGILLAYDRDGFGYADYPRMRGYGISLTSRPSMLRLAQQVGEWHEVLFAEHDWDEHQDVYAFRKG